MTGSTSGWLWVRGGGDGDELRSLFEWFNHDDALRGRVRLEYADIRSGQMGGVIDALVVAVGSGGMGVVLAGALSTWISQRRADVKLTVTSQDGRRIELTAERVDPRTVWRDIRELVEPPEAPR